MMCDPCFMDANQVGYVHELTWDEIQEIMDNAMQDQAAPADVRSSSPAASRRCRPYFIDAVAYARKLGYASVQAATNGIEFAKSKEFCEESC